MTLPHWYANNFISELSGRYIHLDHVLPLLNSFSGNCKIEYIAMSEKGKPIPMAVFGSGSKKVLAWSQMHGNESTTTKALMDFLNFLDQGDFLRGPIQQFLSTHTLYAIPILNPDGAELYTRENANGIDLNRDAQKLSQMESKALRKIFDKVNPELCLNLHDQRSIYGLPSGEPAVVSFLSPAAGPDRALTPARKIAMKYIAEMYKHLQPYLPKKIGRYDDTFNENCVGDTFTSLGVPTILFEAGHQRQDYQREATREYIFYALAALFNLVGVDTIAKSHEEYFEIPENLKNYRDILVRNIRLDKGKSLVSLAIQYEEVLENGDIVLKPKVDSIGELADLFGHREIDGGGATILVNSQEKVRIGETISEITDKEGVSIVNFK